MKKLKINNGCKDLEKQLYPIGFVAYTVHNKQVIRFPIDATAVRTLPTGIKIRDYYCRCSKHHLPPPTHRGNNGRDRIRQNINLFETPEAAQAALNKIL